ncbi:MAG: zinc-binding dehydrogenase [Nanoarchaeota archaeon]|nr:zinc-binding dehydrogenase [Nanoarchaeota archaeon]
MENLPATQRGYILTKEGVVYRDNLTVPQEIPPGFLLLKIMGSSICGTDFGMMKGKKDPWTVENVFPKMVEGIDLIFGHEFYGKVVQRGTNTITNLGEIGASESHYPCPDCMEKGIDGHTCNHFGIFGIWGYEKIDKTHAPVLGGGYSEYILVPESNFYPVGDLYKTFLCSLIEPLGNTFMIAEDIAERNIKGNVLLYGSGPHGLNLQVFLKYFGVKNIVAVEPNDFRRGFAKGIGAANLVVTPNELTKKFVDTTTGGKGFDAVIDIAGFKSVVDQVLDNDLISEEGIFGLFGLPKEENRSIKTIDNEYNMSDFIFGRNVGKGMTESGREFMYVGYSGRTDKALKNLIAALQNGDQGMMMQVKLQKQLRMAGPLNEFKNMLDSGFPGNMGKDELKIGFTEFI